TQRAQPLRQFDRRNIGVSDVTRYIRQLFHLARSRLSKFLAAMTRADVPEARQPVDKLAAVRGPNGGCLTLNPDERILLIVWMEKRMDQMIVIGRNNFPYINCYRHQIFFQ